MLSAVLFYRALEARISTLTFSRGLQGSQTVASVCRVQSIRVRGDGRPWCGIQRLSCRT